MGMVDQEKLKADILAAGKKVIENTKKIFQEHDVISPDIRLVEKEDPVDYAKRIVEAENIDLVVVGSKGHSTLEQIFLGSTAEKIGNDVKSDVLFVR
jgi:nucleotide-binding universal stress UspA family protein